MTTQPEFLTAAFTVSILEDGVVTKTRSIKGKFDEILARLVAQNPGCVVNSDISGMYPRASLTREGSDRTIKLGNH